MILRSIYEKRPEAEWVRLKIPSLISEKEWQALQERITRSRSDGTHYLKGDQTDDRYLLRGLATCGLCGARLQPYDGTAKGSRYYACFWSRPSNAKNRGRQPCASPWMPAHFVEERPNRLLILVLTMPNEVVRQYGELTAGKTHQQNLQKRLAEAQREQQQVKEQIYRMIHGDIARRGYPSDILEEVLAERKERLAYVEGIITERQAAVEVLEAEGLGLERLKSETRWMWEHGQRLKKWLQTATIPQRRLLLRALVNPDGGGAIRVYPPAADWKPDPDLLDYWWGRTEVRFRFDPVHLLTALEGAGALKAGASGRGGAHGEGDNVPPAKNGSDYTSGAGVAQSALTARGPSRRMPPADSGGMWEGPWT